VYLPSQGIFLQFHPLLKIFQGDRLFPSVIALKNKIFHSLGNNSSSPLGGPQLPPTPQSNGSIPVGYRSRPRQLFRKMRDLITFDPVAVFSVSSTLAAQVGSLCRPNTSVAASSPSLSRPSLIRVKLVSIRVSRDLLSSFKCVQLVSPVQPYKDLLSVSFHDGQVPQRLDWLRTRADLSQSG